MDADNVTDADVKAMHEREKHWTPTVSLIRDAQERIDMGTGGIYHGIRLCKIDTNEYLTYPFIIEIRHLHE